MRIIIQFNSLKDVLIPIHYNEVIQGFIYNSLNRVIASFLHDEGFTFGKRKFKLFTFSRILGSVKVEKTFFRISPPFSLIISSPLQELLQNLAETLLFNPEVTLCRNRLYIESITVKTAPSLGQTVQVEMLSPLTVYSTFETPDGRKKTYYYHPKEKEFSELVARNLIKKYTAFYGQEPKCQKISIEPVNISSRHEKLIKYRGFIIKGWMGRYKLSGPEELLRFAYDAGLGAKNSQGFGCFEIVKNECERVLQ